MQRKNRLLDDAKLLSEDDEDSADSTTLKSQMRRRPGNLSISDHLWEFLELFVRPNLKLILLAVIIGLSLVTRLHHLAQPPSVAWDETHFGKFANHYIHRQFFFDVHPPLGKMIIAFAGKLTGYDGNFPFKAPGDKYEQTAYTGMRACCALFGALIAPLLYGTVLNMGFTAPTAFLCAFAIICDNGMLALSRYILLDPILMYFIAASMFSYSKFKTHSRQPFSGPWLAWLVITGVNLALTCSVKWVGLFVVAYVGVGTILELWDLLGDLSLSVRQLMEHFFVRAFALILIPALVYVFVFSIHFAICTNSGPGDGFMSSQFQTTLAGNELHSASGSPYLAFGSKITLKSHRNGGGLLHSHPHAYPSSDGKGQQQITCYLHKDSNNHFLVKRRHNEELGKEPVLVRHGDIVRLEHVLTRRNLHSHPIAAPLTVSHYQVTAYGHEGVGDGNDDWRVEVVNSGHQAGDTHIAVLTGLIRFVHVNMKCALRSHSKNLPKWGWEQQEVTCNPKIDDPENLWNIELHLNEQLSGSVSYQDMAPSFLSSLIEIHAAMAEVNNGLVPKENEITSRPWQWPIDHSGQKFTGWADSDIRVYLIGNPIIFFGNIVVTALFGVYYVVWLLASQRGYQQPASNQLRHRTMLVAVGSLLVGWALHYLPFYLMGRVLYFHHYFPALMFHTLSSGILVDYFFTSLKWTPMPKLVLVSRVVYGSIYALLFLSFVHFSPLAYGMIGDLQSWRSSMYTFSTWDL